MILNADDDHIDPTHTLRVRSLLATRRFYATLLGLEAVERAGTPTHSVVLRADGEHWTGQSRPRRGRRLTLLLTTRADVPSANCLSIELPSAAALDRVHALAAALRSPTSEIFWRDGLPRCVTWDPDDRPVAWCVQASACRAAHRVAERNADPGAPSRLALAPCRSFASDAARQLRLGRLGDAFLG